MLVGLERRYLILFAEIVIVTPVCAASRDKSFSLLTVCRNDNFRLKIVRFFGCERNLAL